VKDALIGILRERHEPDAWAFLLAKARALAEGEGV
jgi:hypothetical protein